MLSQSELQSIKNHLATGNLELSVYDEMLDHYCCEVEKRMVLGLSFQQAFERAKEELPHAYMQQINRNKRIINRKKHLLKMAPIFVPISFLLIGVISLSPSQNDWQNPFSEKENVRMASGFGYRKHPITKLRKMHTGVDFAAEAGTPIHPIEIGKIVEVNHSIKGYGNSIKVDHNNGYISFYCHLQDIFVEVGDKVALTDTIGTVGSSGLSFSPHLHLEVIKGKQKINPISLLYPKKKE